MMPTKTATATIVTIYFCGAVLLKIVVGVICCILVLSFVRLVRLEGVEPPKLGF